MTLREEARRSRFHQYGPWGLVLTTALVAVAVLGVRNHDFNRFEVIYFCVLIPSIILHEVSHGVVAYFCGDDTAKRAGRLTLNPFRHIDPIGTVILPIILVLAHGPAFGWARPVPVSVNGLRRPRNQSVLVSLAGPATNIVLAAASGLVLYLVTDGGRAVAPDGAALVGIQILFYLGLANCIIAVFNLIPIPPLDGSALIERLLPESALPAYYRIRPYSMVLVLLIVFFDRGLLSNLYDHAVSIWQQLCLPNL